MKQIDSFIQSQEQSNITSPVLQATLRANWYLQSGTTRAGNELYVIDDAIVFNNHLIYASRTNLITHSDTLLSSGYTMMPIGKNPLSASDFFINGSTLIWRYTTGAGAAGIYELSSSDGYTWGGSILILGLSNFSYGNSIESTSTTNFLLSSPQRNINQPVDVGIYNFNNFGSWGLTLIAGEQDVVANRTVKVSSLGNTSMNVVYHEYQDEGPEATVFKGISTAAWTFIYNGQYSVKRFLWDGINYLPLDDFFPLVKSELNKEEPSINQFHISTISKGQTNYYMAVSIDKAQDLTVLTGVSTILIDSSIYLLKSQDGINWSNGQFVSNTRGTYTPLIFYNQKEYTPCVVTGITNGQDVVKVLFNDTMMIQDAYGLTPIMISEKIYTFGATSIDISNDVLNYSNSNNQRITLTINNNV